MDWEGRLLWSLVKPWVVLEMWKDYNLKLNYRRYTFESRMPTREDVAAWNIEKKLLDKEFLRIRIDCMLICKSKKIKES